MPGPNPMYRSPNKKPRSVKYNVVLPEGSYPSLGMRPASIPMAHPLSLIVSRHEAKAAGGGQKKIKFPKQPAGYPQGVHDGKDACHCGRCH